MAGSSRWTVLVVLCLSLLLVAVDSTVLHVAVPAVTEDLRPGSIELLWIVDAYPLVAASLLILFGTLGDRVGRRRVLLCGYGCFGSASLLATVADSPHVLIAARVLLGVGGAMIMPATLSILRQIFPSRRERALAIGIWSAVAAVGAAGGPLLGGFLLAHFWWGSVFLINIPLMVLAIPVARWLLPESTGDRDGPWDLAGALMAAAGLFALIFGVKEAGGSALAEPAAVVPLVGGALLLVLFLRRQYRLPHPLIDVHAFARPAFSTSVSCIVIAMLALVGLQLIAAQYLQLVLDLSPLQTGMRMLPLTCAAMVAGLVGSRLLHRVGPRAMVVSGFLITATAVLLLTTMGQQDRPVLLAVGFVLLGCGLELTLFGSYESMLNEASPGQAGSVAAVGETAYQLGAGIGIALLGSVMNAVYGPRVEQVPGVPAAESGAARDSLGAAYEVSARLGGDAGVALRAAARDAFVAGLHVTLAVSALLLLGGALAALRLPRTVEAPPGPGVEEGAVAFEAAGGPAKLRTVNPKPEQPEPESESDPDLGPEPGAVRRTAAVESSAVESTAVESAVTPAAERGVRIVGQRGTPPGESTSEDSRAREELRERDGRRKVAGAGPCGQHEVLSGRPGRPLAAVRSRAGAAPTAEPGPRGDEPRPAVPPGQRRTGERGPR